MEEVISRFPFRKLKQSIYHTLDVMMYVERSQVLEYIFRVNKEARIFL